MVDWGPRVDGVGKGDGRRVRRDVLGVGPGDEPRGRGGVGQGPRMGLWRGPSAGMRDDVGVGEAMDDESRGQIRPRGFFRLPRLDRWGRGKGTTSGVNQESEPSSRSQTAAVALRLRRESRNSHNTFPSPLAHVPDASQTGAGAPR